MSDEQFLITYLKQEGFSRFVQAWITKYKSIGHFGGSIILHDLNDLEKQALESFLGLDLHQRKLRLTASQFTRILANTRFENIDFIKVLQKMSDTKIYTKKECNEQQALFLKQWKEKMLYEYKNNKGYPWLEDYLANPLITTRYILQDALQYKTLLDTIMVALEQLPYYFHNYELLAVFAQNVSRNPHYFDNGLAKEVLTRAICFTLDIEYEKFSLGQYANILKQVGILKDDVSNYCYICHITSQDENLWKEFYCQYEPWNMNLFNLNGVTKDFKKTSIYIIENPSVFRYLAQFIKANHLDVGLVCANGQINLCTYTLLDMLESSGCTLYYAGDFDPEGLVIANKLKERYKNLNLWGYTKTNFNTISISGFSLTSKRLQMLENISNLDLKLIGDLIKSSHVVGYQEGLIAYYQESILKDYK